jgi:hypothetical protein
MTGKIPICSGVGNTIAIFIIIKASEVKIPYRYFIVKTGFCYKFAKIPGCWIKEDCLTTCTLCQMGYKNVKIMAGDWKAWRKGGYPILNVDVVKGDLP